MTKRQRNAKAKRLRHAPRFQVIVLDQPIAAAPARMSLFARFLAVFS